MSAEALSIHPLIAAAEALAGRSPRTRTFGRALEQWIAPMYEGHPFVFAPAQERVLRGAAARLADVGGQFHPDQRVEIMFDLVLRAPLAAINHAERAFLAAAIHHRYTKAQPKHAEAYVRLLNEDQRAAAAALGAALRLGADLSGRSDNLLSRFDMERRGSVLELKPQQGAEDLVTDIALRRLDAAASALGLKAETKVTK